MNTTRSANVGSFAQGAFTDYLQTTKEKTTIQDIKKKIVFEKMYKNNHKKASIPKVKIPGRSSIEDSINPLEFDMVQTNIGLNHGLAAKINK
jgi:hypothetical protein